MHIILTRILTYFNITVAHNFKSSVLSNIKVINMFNQIEKKKSNLLSDIIVSMGVLEQSCDESSK